MGLKAVFLDRDGTLNKAVLNRPDLPEKPITAPFKFEELEFVPHLQEALGIMRDAGYKLIVITNQPDVANGYLTQHEWEKIHFTVMREVEPDDWIACRHRSVDKCKYKKPSPEMILAMAEKWDIDLTKSYMIGDTSNDTIAGKAAGCKTILIRWPYNLGTETDFIVPSLLEAAKLIASR